MRKLSPVLVVGLWLSILLSSSATAEDANNGMPVDPSTWIGVGHQTGGWTWDIELMFGQDDLEINYPSLECGGIWTVETDTKTGEQYYRERLGYGTDNCIDGGRVTLTKTPDGLKYQWSDDEGKITATATLHRRENMGEKPTVGAPE